MKLPRPAQRALASAVLALLSACATTPPGSGGNAADPWEGWNRKVFSFNETIDEAVLKPVAETYRDVLPSFVRTGVSNVLSNIYDVWGTVNHLLQGKFTSGIEMGMRVINNTVFGVLGLFDTATPSGLPRHPEDFGQTLGVWGVPNGPFLVLPLLGPSTLRDTAGFLVDRQTAPSQLAATSTGGYAVTGVEVVNIRANLLSAGSLVDQVALDKYSFIRDGYLSRRLDALYDGAPPMDTFQDEGDDAPAPVGAPTKPPAAAPALTPTAAPASTPR